MALTIDPESAPDRILDTLRYFDACFPRPITARVDDVAAHARKLADRGNVLIARHDGIVSGFAAFYANDQASAMAFLVHLAVSAAYRGKGIGLALMEGCIARSKAAGMIAMKLEVDAANASAIAFYRSLGFAISGPASPISHFMVRADL